MFQRATRHNLKLRMALSGPSGSGKTYTALRLAHALGKPVAVVDTENRSAEKYADEPNPDGGAFEFDVMHLQPEKREPEHFIAAIDDAERGGYGTLVLDSLSHAWMGVLAEVDAKASSSKSKNSFDAWRTVTPRHNALVDRLIHCRMHLIATLRTKTEYVIEEDSRGKKVPRKIGLAPVFRDGIEYEFDVAGDMDSGTLTVGKTRCAALFEKSYTKPGAPLARVLLDWLERGGAPPAQPAAQAAQVDPNVAIARQLLDQVQLTPAVRANAEQLLAMPAPPADRLAKLIAHLRAQPAAQPAQELPQSLRELEAALPPQAVAAARAALGIQGMPRPDQLAEYEVLLLERM